MKLVKHVPGFTEKCESCGKTEDVKDIEVQADRGRQLLRTFLCLVCRMNLVTLIQETI